MWLDIICKMDKTEYLTSLYKAIKIQLSQRANNT